MGLAVTLLLAVTALFAVWTLTVEISYYRSIVDLIRDTFTGTARDIDRLEQSAIVANLLFLIASIVTGIVWLVWLHRRYQNLRSLGRPPKYSPASAVWSWFVPIFNLIRPYQVTSDLWVRSEPDDVLPRGGSSNVMRLWWGALLSSGFLTRAIHAGDPETLEDFRGVAFGDIVVDVLWIAAAVLAIVTVRDIERRQVALAVRLERMPVEQG